MDALTVVFPDQVVRAICRTLVYSLCWGVFAAVLTGIVLLLTKKTRSVIRYFLVVGILVLFVIAAFFTFYRQLAVTPVSTATLTAGVAVAPGPATAADGITIVPSIVSQGRASIIKLFSLFCDRYSSVIVFLWVLIIAYRCIRITMDLRKVHALTRRQVEGAGAFWDGRLGDLSAQLRIHVPVRLLQSAIVGVPVTLGHLKPIILIPAGIVMAMNQEQVQAVLLHELAHIRRK